MNSVSEKTVHQFQKWLPLILSMTEQLSKGDPYTRIAISTDEPALNSLASSLNSVAEFIQENIEDNHELAIGLCEHYEALNRIASGKFGFKASENSSNELVVRLGALINKSSDAMLKSINDLQEKERALELSYNKLLNIVEFLPDATFVIDEDKKVIAWNRALEKMTGVDKSEMMGGGDYCYSLPFYGYKRPVLIDLLDLAVSEIAENYSYIKREGNTLFAENFIQSFCGGNGAYLWITASPLFDADGKKVGAIESIRDISDLKFAEIKNAELNEQLRQAQKMEAIGQLAGGIAHDFNNLLTGIIGYTELLAIKSQSNPQHIKYIDNILEAARKATRLTSDMLAFGRKQMLDQKIKDLSKVVLSIEDMLKRLIGEDIIVKFEKSLDPLPVFVDAAQIQQVLLNLATNARDAMMKGGQIVIKTEECSSDCCHYPENHKHENNERYAVLTVSDTGLGMDEETKAKIFEPFFTTKGVGKGTGLGLSMVFGIVAQHNGNITVRTTPGEGSCFVISLPLYDNLETENGEKGAVKFCKKATDATILVVEDNDCARDVICEVLSDAGFNLITAVDGFDAVEKFRANSGIIDMLLLDLIMPKMNGSDARNEILKIAGRDLPYLFMSGYTDDILKEKGGFEGKINFISKPVTPNELLEAVLNVLCENESQAI